MIKGLSATLIILLLTVIGINLYTQIIENSKQMTATINFAQGFQGMLEVTTKRLATTERQLTECVKYAQQLRETNTQQESVVLGSAKIIKDLSDDIAKLQIDLDSISIKLILKTWKLMLVEQELKQAKKTLTSVRADMEKLRVEYEKQTGKPAPLPTGSLK